MKKKIILTFLTLIYGLHLIGVQTVSADACSDCKAAGNTAGECAGFCGGGIGATGGGSSVNLLVNLNDLIDKTLGGLNFRFNSNATLGNILSAAFYIALAFAGVGFLLYLIYGGFGYLTSSGDPKKTEAAKGILTTAVIGFGLVVASLWISQIVNFIFNLGGGFS